MSILQWNLRSFRRQRTDLRFLLHTYSPLVVCLQETLLTAPPVPIPRYHFVHSPHSLSDSCILIHDTVPYVTVSVPTSLPCTVARVFLRRWVTVVSLYLSPSVPIDFALLLDLISRLPTPFLLLGDFNCRHTLWGDTLINTRGRLLEAFLSAHDLFLLNTGAPTHFDARTRSFSCLDLSFCSPSLSLDFSWSVLEDHLYSDHFPVFLQLSTSLSSPSTPLPHRWCFGRADWPTFTSLTVPQVPPSSFRTVDSLLTFFVTTILAAALAAIPRSSRPAGSKCVPWWSLDCSRALRLKRARWKSYRRKQGTPDSLRHFILFR